MNASPIGPAALLALALLAGPAQGFAASPAEIAAQRQEILNDMLTDDYQPSSIANVRRSCALGLEPAHVIKARSGGADFTPDAADSCVTALVRTGRDRNLPELYGKLAVELGGSPDGYEQLPRAIGAAVLSGDGKVAIGNGKAAVVPPALAFDAGFAVAYLEGAANKQVNPEQLKAAAETCLAQQQKPGICFSVGYVYGARAFNVRE